MLWFIYTILLILGVAGLLAPYGMISGLIQIVMTSIFVWIGIDRILAISKRIRRYQGV